MLSSNFNSLSFVDDCSEPLLFTEWPSQVSFSSQYSDLYDSNQIKFGAISDESNPAYWRPSDASSEHWIQVSL